MSTFTQYVTVALIVGPTFLAFVLHLVAAKQRINAKWEENQERRRRRKATGNLRLAFDSRGRVAEESMKRCEQLHLAERIIDMLHTLGSAFAFSSPTLYEHHACIRDAMEVADRRKEAVLSYMQNSNLTRQQLSVFEAADKLLSEFRDRLPLTGKPKLVLTQLKQQLNHVDGRRTSGPSTLQHLEPTELIKGVHLQGSRFLGFLTAMRDKLNIGSWRWLLTLVAALLMAGPVRFMGFVPAMLVLFLLIVVLLLDLCRLYEHSSLRGAANALGPNLARMVFPVVLAILLLVLFPMSPPESNEELEDRFTFLPVPPQYSLSDFFGQRYYVSAIYGIMHANLMILFLLPLPLCYSLQAKFVQACPRLAFLVPQNPVWLHRTLGYALVGGISGTAFLWLVFQGCACLASLSGVADGDATCLAFNPAVGAGLDVFVLRFYIVWPLLFFLVPLMIFDRWPDSELAPPRKVESTGSTLPPEEGASAWSQRAVLRSTPSDSTDEGPPTGTSCAAKCCIKSICMLKFIYKHLPDACLVIVPLAGCKIIFSRDDAFPFPFWLIILLLVVLRCWVRFRTYVKSAASRRDWTSRNLRCLHKDGPWPEFFDRSWWELAYTTHVIGFTVSIFFALFFRFEVFYPCLLTWGLYGVDRALGVHASVKNTSHVIVESGVSSYVVSKGEGCKASPSHVRLVVKKPDGFKYRAGQWVHLACPGAGTYCGVPALCLPLLQWHPFSIASAEEDDFLEFHIAVSVTDSPIADGSEVRIWAADGHFAQLGRRGHWLDRILPFKIPYFGKVPEVGTGAKIAAARESGVCMQLTFSDGTTIRALKPQMQWTGKLWNMVHWLLEQTRSPEPQMVRIMGPYGTLPYVCDRHKSVMLIGAGVGFPSMGSMLRRLLRDNLSKTAEEKKPVCFVWTASKVDQLLLCFPGLLADLAAYVHRSSLAELKSWLTVKIFISSFKATDFLNLNPDPRQFPEGAAMSKALKEVRAWLLGRDTAGTPSATYDADGTYIAEGSLGASFSEILRNSLFIKQHVIAPQNTLGVCFCGPADLSSWIRSDLSQTLLPVRVEYASECTS